MRQPLLFLIIIFTFTTFAYLSIQQISALHNLSPKHDTTYLSHKITHKSSLYIQYTTINKSKDLNFEYEMDSLVVRSDDSSDNFKKDISKIIYNIYVFNSEDADRRFQAYTATQITNFCAKVRYKIRTSGSSYSYDNYVITALIYLENGDIVIPDPIKY